MRFQSLLNPHLIQFVYRLQYGSLMGHSNETQLLEVYHDTLASLACGNEINAIYLDLSKVFDRVSHNFSY